MGEPLRLRELLRRLRTRGDDRQRGPAGAAGTRLERREGVINVLVAGLKALEQRDTEAEVQQLDPPAAPATRQDDELAQRRRARELAIAELRAVAPAGHASGGGDERQCAP